MKMNSLTVTSLLILLPGSGALNGCTTPYREALDFHDFAKIDTVETKKLLLMR
ncbi:MAG: hypothetical protein ACE5IY_10260 [bacterium]